MDTTIEDKFIDGLFGNIRRQVEKYDIFISGKKNTLNLEKQRLKILN